MPSSTSEKVKILKGKESMRSLLDDVFETLKDSGGEVYISGVDERKFLEADRGALEEHIKRLHEHGITERLLVREENTFFFPGPQSWYRLVPEKLFNPTLMYVYGEKLAMVLWGPPVEIIIIQNTALADAYRKQFLFMWERAQMSCLRLSNRANARSRINTPISSRAPKSSEPGLKI